MKVKLKCFIEELSNVWAKLSKDDHLAGRWIGNIENVAQWSMFYTFNDFSISLCTGSLQFCFVLLVVLDTSKVWQRE